MLKKCNVILQCYFCIVLVAEEQALVLIQDVSFLYKKNTFNGSDEEMHVCMWNISLNSDLNCTCVYCATSICIQQTGSQNRFLTQSPLRDSQQLTSSGLMWHDQGVLQRGIKMVFYLKTARALCSTNDPFGQQRVGHVSIHGCPYSVAYPLPLGHQCPWLAFMCLHWSKAALKL